MSYSAEDNPTVESQESWLADLLNDKDWLYFRLASKTEGWAINSAQGDEDVPLNQLDAAAYKILLRTIEKKKRVAIALPRIKAGVSLSLVAYLAVNRFLTEELTEKTHGKIPKGFTPVPLRMGQRIIVATRDTKLRGLFLDSSLSFAGDPFPFYKYFPIVRIKRTGETVPLVGKKIAQKHIQTDPIIFYHLNTLDYLPPKAKNSVLIGELTENDSSDIALRLVQFSNSIRAESTLVLVNEFANATIQVLKDSGFEVICFSSREICGSKRFSESNLPSLGSSLSPCPDNVMLNVNIVKDDLADQKLSYIVKALVELNKKLGDKRPQLLLYAWGIFYSLKDLSVPLSRLEKGLRNHPWLKTLNYNISKVFDFPLSRLDDEERYILQPVWGVLGLEFKELYKHLETSGNKYWKLAEIVVDKEAGNSNLCIVFPTKIQADVFKEELLIEYGWSEYDSNVRVGYLGDMVNYSVICEEVVLPGIWSQKQEPKIFSLLPKRITLLSYTSEIPGLIKTLRGVNGEESTARDNLTYDALESLGFVVKSNISVGRSEWLVPDELTSLIIENAAKIVPTPVETESSSLIDEISKDWLNEESGDIYDQGLETVILDEQDDELVPSYQLTLDNGKVLNVAANQEMMAYSDENEVVQSKLPDALEPGDIILVYSEEQSRKMFLGVLQRTKDLSGADQRVIAQWKNVLEILRDKYSCTGPMSILIKDLRKLGCKKVDIAIRHWIKGLTMAPRDVEDIEYMLALADIKSASVMAKIIDREMESVRSFNRSLGHRLRQRLSATIKGSGEATDSLDAEIDEILEMAEPVRVNDISPEPRLVPKSTVRNYIFG